MGGHYQHLQEPARSQVSQEGGVGESILHNFYSLNAGCLISKSSKGRGRGERAGVWKYQNMWHYAYLVIQNTNLISSRNQIFGPGVSWSISVLPDCGLNVTICHAS